MICMYKYSSFNENNLLYHLSGVGKDLPLEDLAMQHHFKTHENIAFYEEPEEIVKPSEAFVDTSLTDPKNIQECGTVLMDSLESNQGDVDMTKVNSVINKDGECLVFNKNI